MQEFVRQVKFHIDDKEYTLHPISDRKIALLSYLYGLLGLNQDHLKENYILEFLRVAKSHPKEACLIAAICTSGKDDDMERLSCEFGESMDCTDMAALLMAILVYYDDVIKKCAKEGIKYEQH